MTRQPHRHDAEGELDVVIAVDDVQPFPDDRVHRRLGFGECAAQLHEQAGLGEAQEIGGGCAARRLEIGRGAPAKLLDLEVVADQDARRTVAGDDEPIGFTLEVRRRVVDDAGVLRRGPRQPVLSGENQLWPIGRLLLPIDLVGAVGELEEVVERADRLGQPQHQEPVGVQREVEHRQQAFLQLCDRWRPFRARRPSASSATLVLG